MNLFKAFVRFVVFSSASVMLLLPLGGWSHRPAVDEDPFKPYLTSKPPVVIEELGTDTISGIRVQKLVFRSRTVQTPTGEQTSNVYAAIAYPAGSGPHPGLLRLHGGGGSADIPAAVSSAKAGYASIVLDAPGVAGTKAKNPKTTGFWQGRPMIAATPDITSGSLFDAIVASIQAFYLLRSQPGVDAGRMFIAGASWGGYTATMVTSLINKDVKATWSVFGSGNFLEGAYESDRIARMPEAERKLWVKWMDPGSRAGSITKPYFISTASNDRHWSWMAVQATLKDIKGPVNQFYSPNDNHAMNYPGAKNMLHYFDHYAKKDIPELPKVLAGRTKKQTDGSADVEFTVKDATEIVAIQVFYADAAPVWTAKKWLAVDAKADGRRFTAHIPAGVASKPFNWYAIARDKNPRAWGKDSVSCSSLIQIIR